MSFVSFQESSSETTVNGHLVNRRHEKHINNNGRKYTRIEEQNGSRRNVIETGGNLFIDGNQNINVDNSNKKKCSNLLAKIAMIALLIICTGLLIAGAVTGGLGLLPLAAFVPMIVVGAVGIFVFSPLVDHFNKKLR